MAWHRRQRSRKRSHQTPATWFIDDLMRHLGRSYYVSLLSAAALHGAGHQQPMALQVIVDAPEREITVGRVRIEFHASGRVREAATIRMQTETGTMNVATPETTAFDLVRYPAASGYWNTIATVLVELADILDPKHLAAGADRTDVQRLGWLLDHIGESSLADSLADKLHGKRLQHIPLTTGRESTDAPLNDRWKILENDSVEVDL